MSSPVLFLCYNRTPEQLTLSQNALASIFTQDIPVEVFGIDNGSTSETWSWMESMAEQHPNFACFRNMENVSPVKVSNFWLEEMFGRMGYQYVLGVPNDVRLPSNCYSQLLRWPRGFVSASDIGQTEPTVYDAVAVNENTPMAVMLTRKWAWEAIMAKDGYFFDEGFVHYASDCCLALRMAACGIRGVQTNVPFWHYGSASWRLSPDGSAMTAQADKDRAYFERKYGFSVSDPRYQQSAADINFKGVGR